MAGTPGASKHRPEEIDAALLELAVCDGSASHAHRALVQRGHKISRQTLVNWSRGAHAERYQEIRARMAPLVEAEIVGQARSNVRKAAVVADELLDVIRAKIATGELDAGKTFQQVSIGLGIHTEKMLLLEGRPTEILETRDTQTLLEDLKQVAPGLVVEGTAIDVTPQELPAKSGQA